MPIYSHSRLERYETYPLQYKFRYVDKVKVEKRDSVEMFLGSRVHEAIQKIHPDLNFHREYSLDSVLQFYGSARASHWHSNVMIVDECVTVHDEPLGVTRWET
jgi:putative RecB family exonuclease